MADEDRNVKDDIDYSGLSNQPTANLVKEIDKIRSATKDVTDRENREYAFPEAYNANMGLKSGRVTELRLFFTVKPGRAEALKAELLKFKESEERNSKLAHVATGIQAMTCTLFDNDTRYLHCTEFDTDWDPYIDDSVPGEKQRRIYANWLQHLVEAGDFGPDNLPSANDIKVLFNQQRVTATVFIRTFGETVIEEYRLRDLKTAWDEFLDHPDAAATLERPEMAALRELASS